MRHWAHRVRPPAVPPEVQHLRQAAEELGHHAGRAPGRARVIFQTVSEVVLVGSITIGGIAAAYHLWEKLTRHPAHNAHEPAQEDDDRRRPPRRHTAATAGHGRQ